MNQRRQEYYAQQQAFAQHLEAMIAAWARSSPSKEGWQMVNDPNLPKQWQCEQSEQQWHLSEDFDLLERWRLDELDDEQYVKIGEHLAECDRCRAEVAEMVACGALKLPRAYRAASVRLKRTSRLRRMGLAAAVAAVAAVFFLLVGGPAVQTWWNDRQVAHVEKAYRAGQFGEAAESALEVWSRRDRLSAAGRQRLEHLLPEVCYRAALDQLKGGRFSGAIGIAERAAACVGQTATLSMVRLQAEQGIGREYSLGTDATVLDYGYVPGSKGTPTGPITADTPPLGPTVFRLKKEFQRAVERHPDHVGLLINFGEFLLRYNWPAEAEQQFAKAAAIEPNNFRARLGLGIAKVRLDRFAEALQQFQAALAIDDQSMAAHMNAAICLDKLGRTGEADQHWREVLRLGGGAELPPGVKQRLDRLGPAPEK